MARRRRPTPTRLHDPMIVKGELWYKGKCTKFENIRCDRKVAQIAFGVTKPTARQATAPSLWKTRIRAARDSICRIAVGSRRVPHVEWSAGLDSRLFKLHEAHFIATGVFDPKSGKLFSYDGTRLKLESEAPVVEQPTLFDQGAATEAS